MSVLERPRQVFMLGIGGSGMRGLALLLAERGHAVTGTDQNYDGIQGAADLASYELVPEDVANDLVRQGEVLIYSDAVRSDHPLRVLARETDTTEMPYHEAVGMLTAQLETIAITGTHGKSSTTAMMAHALHALGNDASVLVGASLPLFGDRNAYSGESDLFVLEADEYRRHFLALRPRHIVLTNIDFDHPDYYSSLEDVVMAYESFFALLPKDGRLICGRDTVEEFPDMAWPENMLVVDTEEGVADVSLMIPGEHMRYNARLVMQMLEHLEIEKQAVREALRSFKGLGRRFELIGQIDGKDVVSDYGHHPKEIVATIQGARERYPGQRILVVLEAHTFERIELFGNDFIEALALADGVLMVPVFIPSGREDESSIREASDSMRRAVCESLKERQVFCQGLLSYDVLGDVLGATLADFDYVVAFSAGELDRKLRAIISG